MFNERIFFSFQFYIETSHSNKSESGLACNVTCLPVTRSPVAFNSQPSLICSPATHLATSTLHNMAIIEALGIEATIVSGPPGCLEALSEYPDDEHEWTEYPKLKPAQRSVKYLECTTDAEFQIKLTRSSECKFAPDHLVIVLFVDNKPIALTSWLTEVETSKSTYIHVLVERISPTELIRTPIKFSSIVKGM